jgi:hypothetical protein
MTLKKAAITAVSAVLLVMVAAFATVKVMIDPERLKQVARDKVRKAWSRELTLADVKLEFTPLPTISAREVEVKGDGEPAMRAAALIADLELVPLLLGEARYRTIYVRDGTIERGGSTWRIEEAILQSAADLRNVEIKASLWRNRKHVGVQAQFDDLSKLGKAGAVTDGRVRLEWGEASLVAAGRMPLDGTLASHALTVDVDAPTLKDLAEFFDMKRRPAAPFSAHFQSRDDAGVVAITDLKLALGRLRLAGDARYTPGPKPVVNLTLAAPHLDWARTYLDFGGEPAPPPAPPEMFNDTPLAWWIVTGLQGYRGTADIRLATFILRNGVVLTDFHTQVRFEDDKLDFAPFETKMLGGTARGAIRLAGANKSARFDFEGSGLLLERWLRERSGQTRFKGGPMKVSAKLESRGNSMRQLVGSMNGPMKIRMGPGTLASERAGGAEAKLTATFSGKEGQAVEFECAGFNLPFKSGRASGERIISARTSVSDLVTSGFVDMRSQEIDLHGRLKARHGVSLAAIAGDVKFTGTTRHPKIAFDEKAAPKPVARGALAVATLGLTALGTAAADAEEGRNRNPCETVFR